MRLRDAVVAVTVAALAIIGVVPAAQAGVVDKTNGTDYWETEISNEIGGGSVTCYKDAYGAVTNDGKSVTLPDHDPDWMGTGYVALIVKGGNEGPDGAGNKVTLFPKAGVAYAAPKNHGGQPADVSHYIVCMGSMPVDYEVSCDAVTVTYPKGIDSIDVNIKWTPLPGGSQKTQNYHPNTGATVGQVVTVTLAATGYYSVDWVQVNGTNFHWKTGLTCGEPEKPEQPQDKVETTAWEVSDYSCESETVDIMREVTTTKWVWDSSKGAWVLSDAPKTVVENSSRAMTADEKAEMCDEPPVVDVCSNVPGKQDEAPAGWKVNPDGTCEPCEPPVVDVCPNLKGDQATVPEGMVKDDAGDCVEPPVDVCLNIDGVQTEVPEGLMLDDGTCYKEATVKVGEWSGEPVCGINYYLLSAIETATTYTLEQSEAGYSWVVDKVTPREIHKRVNLDEVLRCEDASAAITVTPASCAAPGAIDEVTMEHATVDEAPATEPGEHSVTFTANEGHAFAGGAVTLTLEYTVEAQLTEGCEVDEPQEPTLDGTIVGAVCTADAPYLGYSIVVDDPDGQSDDDGTATITFVHPTDPSQNVTRTVDIGEGRILWPGASVDADGVADGWPGWEYNPSTEEWDPIGDGNYGWTREPDTEVIIGTNPTASFTVSYPPATPECNSEPPTDIVIVLDAPPAIAVTGVATYTG
ncbi:hypothetical protein [Demequina mangrovi]|uniref:Uncharacterized protein n=1 Tax=Demequina mangrovi TaxID=1043493 RepID=A0A1H6YVD4_9MICO|nr:hypothetical protein [Demequina mangrovi]SEJ41312.1 hypothetical protein SAMN05421637_1769 [Demequina mangrovi]